MRVGVPLGFRGGGDVSADVSTEADIAVVRGVVYLCAEDGVLGVDVATGARRWRLAGKPEIVFNSVGGVRDGAVYVTVFDQQAQRREVWSVDIASGGTRWAVPCQSDNTLLTVPTVGPMVFAYGTGGSGFIALDATKKGVTAWSRTGDRNLMDSVVVADGVILSAFGSDDTVAGLDLASGHTVWQSPPLRSANSSAGFFQVFTPGGSTYYTWDGADLAAHRTGGGATQLWSVALQGPSIMLNAEAVFDDSTLYFVGDALYALDLQSGRTRWRHTVSGEFPLSADTRLTAGGGACYVDSGGSVTACPAL